MSYNWYKTAQLSSDIDWMNIGPVPPNEDCEQLGPNYDAKKARAECQRYMELLRQTLGREPQGARLGIKGNEHEFGTYYEVVCYYDTKNEAAREYAFKCESQGPQNWAETPPPAPEANQDLDMQRDIHENFGKRNPLAFNRARYINSKKG